MKPANIITSPLTLYSAPTQSTYVAVGYYMYECRDPWHSVNECMHSYMYLSSQVDALREESRAERHESMHSYNEHFCGLGTRLL